MLEVTSAGPAHFERLAALFEACACNCFCRYWHFGGSKNDWLARTALSPEENRDEMKAALMADDDTARGLIAIDNAAENKPIVGWMKLAPRAAVPKLRNLPVYRAHDLGDDAHVFSIGCFLVHPEHRKRGVAAALLAGAGDLARALGGVAVEAYPHAVDPVTFGLNDEQAWMGPATMFERAGFVKVAGEMPYPVLRLLVGDQTESRL